MVVLSPPAQSEEPPEPPRNARRGAAPYVIASAILLALVFFERWVLSVHTFSIDVWSAHVGMSHKPWPIWDLTRLYQQVGRPLVAIGEVLVMGAWLWRNGGRRPLEGLVIALVASVICKAIKIIWGATPLWRILPDHVGANFPSGVVTFMAASVGYVALVGWRNGHRKVPIFLALAILGTGPARVVGGQHLFSDVVGGYMLGISWLLLAYVHLTRPGRRTPPGQRTRGLRATIQRRPQGTPGAPSQLSRTLDAGPTS